MAKLDPWQTAAVVGPALGGLIYGFTSPRVACIADAIMMAVAVPRFSSVTYGLARRPRDPSQSVTACAPVCDSRSVNRSSCRRSRSICFRCCMAGSRRCFPHSPIRSYRSVRRDSAFLRGAPAASAVVASVYLARRPEFKRAGQTLLYAVATFALCIVGVGVSRGFMLSVARLRLDA